MRCVFSSFAQLHSKRTVHPGVKIFHIEENLPETENSAKMTATTTQRSLYITNEVSSCFEKKKEKTNPQIKGKQME